jgi:N-acetylmuramoyl-L-alanine amidase
MVKVNGTDIIMVPSENQRPRKAGRKPQYIVLHGTEGSFNGAVNWLSGKGANKESSAHFVVSRKGDIVSMVDTSQCAFHAGKAEWEGHIDINDRSIGIEMENISARHQNYPDAQLQAVVALCALLCRKWKIPADSQHIVTHKMVSPGRKSDPVGFPYDIFLQHLKKEMGV